MVTLGDGRKADILDHRARTTAELELIRWVKRIAGVSLSSPDECSFSQLCYPEESRTCITNVSLARFIARVDDGTSPKAIQTRVSQRR